MTEPSLFESVIGRVLLAFAVLAATSAQGTGAADAAMSNESSVSDSWTGAYLGLAAGAKRGDAQWTTTQLSDPPSAFVGVGSIDGSSPDGFTPAGARLGGYAGYNWQSDRWIYGIEVDAAWADASETHAGIPGCKIVCFPGTPGPGNDASAVSIRWDASLRGRIGYLVMPKLLVYGTGGIAWQSLDVSGTCESTLNDPVCLVAPPFGAKTQSDRAILTGWTVGGGIEHKLAGAWLIRAEYRYADFGSASGVLWAGQPATSPGADAVHYDVTVKTHIATVGLAYKF